MKSILSKYLLGIYLFLVVADSVSAQERVQGDIIIQLAPKTNVEYVVEQINSSNATIDLSIGKQLSGSWNIWLLHTDSGNDEQALRVLQSLPEISNAQYNRIAAPRDTFPNDTFYIEQWAYKNTGQSNGVIGADIEAERAWGLTTGGITADGDTIVVAVIDGGVDLNHVDLSLWKNSAEIPGNSIDDDLNGYIDDYDGWNAGVSNGTINTSLHGTHVSGVVGAIGNNSIGVSGVNWQVKVLPISVMNYTEAEVVEAYSYVFDVRKQYDMSNGIEGAFVVATNASFGVDLGKPQDYPLWCAIFDSLGSLGILNTGAAPNGDINVDVEGDIPTACVSDYLISVTSTTRLDRKAASTGYGKVSIDLGAPGVGIRSTTPNNFYGVRTGTSSASPHVAGAIALFYSAACPDLLTAYKNRPDSISLLVRDYLFKGTEPLDDLDQATVTGGRLNIWNSLNRFVNEQCIDCLDINYTATDVQCFDGSDGTISVNASGGNAPYVYEWNTSDTVDNISNLSAGTYFTIVTDSSGCERYRYIDLEEPESLSVLLSVDSAVNDSSNGSVLANVSGGTPPYNYLWSDSAGSTNPSIINLSPGIYTVTVTDDNGCVAFSSGIVGQIFTGIDPIDSYNSFQVYPNPSDGIVILSMITPQPSSVDIEVTDISGRRVLTKAIDVGVLNQQLDLSHLHQGIYLLHWQDAKGNRLTKKIVLL